MRTPQREVPDLGHLYRETRERLTSLLSALDRAALNADVPACPRWSVRDVVCHLVANLEDAAAGVLSIPPTDEDTAAQVARCRHRDVAEMLGTWAALAPPIERSIAQFGVWPAVIDIASHEQDIHGALGRRGARDTAAIWHGAGWLLTELRTPVPLRVEVEEAEFQTGPPDGTGLGLATSRFEAFRWRMGRRSRAQLAALDWSADPAPVLDHLALFGPADTDIIE